MIIIGCDYHPGFQQIAFAETGYRSVLDAAQGMGLRAVKKVRFARGTARKSRWCEVEHRVIDWVSRSSSQRSSK